MVFRFACSLISLGWLIAPMGCADPATFDVRVDVRTDYRPGRDFVGTRATIGSMGGDAGTDGEAQERLATEGDFLAGERVASFSGVEPGIRLVTVSLIGLDGEVVSSRRVSADVSGSSTVTVVITESCRNQVCPGAGDDESLTECAGGRCVDPRCSPEAPERCGSRCASDGECPAASACTRGVCVAGTCLVAPNDATCGPGRMCDLVDGCEVECSGDPDCGAPVEEVWGPCEAPADDCSGEGRRSREVRVPTCVDGSCAERATIQTEACPVPRPEGTACGAGRVCCGGACSRLDRDDHCGACRVSCASIGTTCAPTGSGGFGCVGCTTDAACRSILNGAATCYSPSGPSWCRCQCPVDGTVCEDGGCGPGFFCNDNTGYAPHYCF